MKINALIVTIISCAIVPFSGAEPVKVVTNGLGGSRVGDQLISYMHAKWVSYKYGLDKLPLFYQPFPYSDQLVLHAKERHLNQLSKSTKKKELVPHQMLDNFLREDDSSQDMLYEIPYFPESLEEHAPVNAPYNVITWARPKYPYFKVEWDDPGFKKLIQEFVAPVRPLHLITPPKNKLSIAIHARIDNGGYDRPLLSGRDDRQFNPQQLYNDVVFPFKHPPLEYYTEQLKKIIELFPDKTFYVYIFTDDPQPPLLVQKFKQALEGNERIEFDYRKTENNHYSNVLEDLFSMAQFDCLIRPDSNLSIVASKLGNFKVVIAPKHHHWTRTLVIDQVLIQRYA